MPTALRRTCATAFVLAFVSIHCRAPETPSLSNRLYVVEDTVVDSMQRFPLQVFDVDPDNGRLSPAAVRIEDSNDAFYSAPSMFSHPTLPFLVFAGSRFRMLEIDGADRLAPLSKEATEHGGTPRFALIRLHPNGRHIYVFHAKSRRSLAGMLVYEMGDGEETPYFSLLGVPHTLGCDGMAVALGPDGQTIYCSAERGRKVKLVDIRDPAGSFNAAAEVDAPEQVREIIAHPNGKFVYALSGAPLQGRKDWLRGIVVGYRRTETAGRLTRVTRRETVLSSWITRIAITPDGSYLYALDRKTNALLGLAIDAEGRLQELGRYRTGQLPREILIDPTGRFVYVINEKSSDIVAFSIGQQGQLVPMPGSPAALTSPPVAMTLGR